MTQNTEAAPAAFVVCMGRSCETGLRCHWSGLETYTLYYKVLPSDQWKARHWRHEYDALQICVRKRRAALRSIYLDCIVDAARDDRYLRVESAFNVICILHFGKP